MSTGHRLSTGSFGHERYMALIRLRYGSDMEEVRLSLGEVGNFVFHTNKFPDTIRLTSAIVVNYSDTFHAILYFKFI